MPLLYILLSLFSLSVSLENAEIQKLFDGKTCIEVPLSSSQEPVLQLIETNPATVPDLSASETAELEYKTVLSRINEIAQLNEVSYSYELIKDEGPAHKKIFTILLRLGNEEYEGVGGSFDLAKESAALAALQSTLYEQPQLKLKRDIVPLTPKSVLNNIALQLGVSVSYILLNGKEVSAEKYGNYEASYGKSKSFLPNINASSSYRVPVEDAQISGPFSVKLKVNDLEFLGIGYNIKSAEEQAATQALKHMEKTGFTRDNVCNDADKWEECKKRKDQLKNPVSRVSEAAQRQGVKFECRVISETGKPHKKRFTTSCAFGDFEEQGEGTSKKEAKEKAAGKLVKHLDSSLEAFSASAILKSIKGHKKKKQKKKVAIRSKTVNDVIKDSLSLLWAPSKTSETSARKEDSTPKGSPKTKILQLGNVLGIHIDFTDLGPKGGFSTLMSLGVQPKHVCLGSDGFSRENAQNNAAINGLKFLHKSGIFEKPEYEKYKSEFLLDYVLGAKEEKYTFLELEEKM